MSRRTSFFARFLDLPARFAFVGAAVIWALPKNWATQLLALFLATAAFALTIWFDRPFRNSSKIGRAAIIAFAMLFLAAIAYRPVLDQWAEDNKPLSDVRANFEIPDQAMTSLGKTTVKSLFVNYGRGAVIVDDLRLLVVQFDFKGRQWSQEDSRKLCGSRATGGWAWLSDASTAERMKVGKDAFGGFVSRYKAASYSIDGRKGDPYPLRIEPAKIVQVTAKFDDPPRDMKEGNTVVFCPALRLIDSEGKLTTVSCSGTYASTSHPPGMEDQKMIVYDAPYSKRYRVLGSASGSCEPVSPT